MVALLITQSVPVITRAEASSTTADPFRGPALVGYGSKGFPASRCVASLLPVKPDRETRGASSKITPLGLRW